RPCFKGVFKQFNLLCRTMGLFGAELVAIDGSKFKAVNNPQRHYTAEQLQELVKKVEQRIDAYLEQLDQQDAEAEGVSGSPNRQVLEQKLAQLRERKGKYDQYIAQMATDQQSA